MRDFSYETDPPFNNGADHYDAGDLGDMDMVDGGASDWSDAVDEEPTVVAADSFGQETTDRYGLPADYLDYPNEASPPDPAVEPEVRGVVEGQVRAQPDEPPLSVEPAHIEIDQEVTVPGDGTGDDASDQLKPPPGFEYNPDILEDYDEQVMAAVAEAAYQAEPIPSFDDVPTLDITPTFNPTGAPDSEIYARDRMPRSLRPHMALRSEWTDDDRPVEMWRIVDRSRLVDGTALVSSRILNDNNLGDVEDFEPTKHLASNHDRRMEDEGSATPLVSFSTDPVNLARRAILMRGFGITEGRDSVVARVQVDPDRVITGPRNKSAEVLLLGGVAPGEYRATYSVADFISRLVADGPVNTARGTMHRDEALDYWAQLP